MDIKDEEYYINIQSLDPELRENLLSSFRDIVNDEKAYNIAISIEEDVFKTSLLRGVSLTSVSGQLSSSSDDIVVKVTS